MKKLLVVSLFTFTFFLSPCLCVAQSWDSVGSGTNGSVNAMIVNNGNLYIAGGFTKAGGIAANNIAVWNGTTWSTLGTGFNGVIIALTIYNGNLYAGGEFTTADGNPANDVAEWNGTTWLPLGSGITSSSYGVFSLAVFNNKLIAGGNFTNAGGIPANSIASWDGTKWDTLSSGVHPNGYVQAMAVYDSVLYAGGGFNNAGKVGARNIAQWDGTAWSALGSGINGGIESMAIYLQSLYAGGYFDSAGGNKIEGLTSWNGTNWNAIGANTNPMPGGTSYCMLVENGILLMGGLFDNVSGVKANAVVSWNGSNWDSLGSGFEKDTVFSLAEYNSEIYAGGLMSASGSTKTENIGRWTYPTGINEIKGESGNVKVYPNPNDGVFALSCHPAAIAGALQINVFNVLGESVLSETFRSAQGDNLIDLTRQPNGVYFYRVLKKDGTVLGSGKIVVQK